MPTRYTTPAVRRAELDLLGNGCFPQPTEPSSPVCRTFRDVAPPEQHGVLQPPSGQARRDRPQFRAALRNSLRPSPSSTGPHRRKVSRPKPRTPRSSHRPRRYSEPFMTNPNCTPSATRPAPLKKRDTVTLGRVSIRSAISSANPRATVRLMEDVPRRIPTMRKSRRGVGSSSAPAAAAVPATGTA